jgi:hypothetical protein
MKTARGFHHAAGELEAMQRRTPNRRSARVRIACLVILSKTSIGRRLIGPVGNGLYFAHHFLFRPKPINHEQLVGRAAGAVVLEALAVELVLKARLHRLGIRWARLVDKHDHSALYALLPDNEQHEADQRYQSIGQPAMHTTLAEALAFSAQAFKQWRYMHEQPSGVQASTGDMRRAFMALAEGM